MNIISYDAFKLISDWLTIKELERLFYTGNKRIMALVCKYPVNDAINISIDSYGNINMDHVLVNVGKLFIKNATFIHHLYQSYYVRLPIIIPRHVDKIDLRYLDLASTDCHDNIKSMVIKSCDMYKNMDDFIQLTKLTIINPQNHVYLPDNSNLCELTVDTTQRNLTVLKFVESLEYIELIGNSDSCDYVLDDYGPLYIDNMRICSKLTTLKLTNLDIPGDLFDNLPVSITSLSLLFLHRYSNMVDFAQCKLELKYLEIGCAVTNLDKLPASLTSLKVHNDTLVNVIDFSKLPPKLLVLHDLYERTLDTKPRDYSTLPSTLLDLSLSDRHIDEICFDIIMTRCPKLARFKVKVAIPGYLYINERFAKLQRRKFIKHHVKFITDYKPE
jgi:hypothetical protein